MQTQNNKRPISAFILAWLFLLGGVFGIIGSILTLVIVLSTSGSTDVASIQIQNLKGMSFLVGGSGVVMGILSIIVAYGLFKMKRWALVLLTIFAATEIVLFFATSFQIGNPVFLLIMIVLTIYFWMIREKFN